MHIAIGVIAILLGLVVGGFGVIFTLLSGTGEASDVSSGMGSIGCLGLVVGLAVLAFGIWMVR